jgi:hypothetical protein
MLDRSAAEDQSSAWLGGYERADFGQVEADIRALEQFASRLSANVKDSYAPHLDTVSTAMMTPLPPPRGEFVELQSFLTLHREAQDVSHQNVYNYANGTNDFALAAQDISKKYEGSDAFAHAQVTDVDKALDHHGIPTDLTGTTEGDR